MDKFLQKLASSSLPGSTSEHLLLLGKRAAASFVEGQDKDLTSAVLREVSEDSALTKDQVERVTRFANQETWRAYLDQGRATEQFSPADSDTVLSNVSLRSPSVVEEPVHFNEYKESFPGMQVEDLFPKNVSEDIPELNPNRAQEVHSEKVASLKGMTKREVEKTSSLLRDSAEEFYQLIKRAHLDDGLGLLEITQATGAVFKNRKFARNVMEKMAARLIAEGIDYDPRDEFTKLAHRRVVNSEHPLVKAAAVLERAAELFKASRRAFKVARS